jgi:hypothetical protein
VAHRHNASKFLGIERANNRRPPRRASVCILTVPALGRFEQRWCGASGRQVVAKERQDVVHRQQVGSDGYGRLAGLAVELTAPVSGVPARAPAPARVPAPALRIQHI